MFGAERRHVVLELLRVNGALLVRDLATTVDVSSVTVRRDLETPVKRGEAERRYDGVALLGIDSTYQTVPPELIAHLIADSRADPRVVASLRDQGSQVHVAARADERSWSFGAHPVSMTARAP